MLRKQKIIGPFGVALFANILLGSSTVAFKFGLDSIDPLVFAGLRYTAVGVMMLLMFVWGFNRIKDKKVLGQLLINSALIGVFIVLWSIGIDKSTALKASLFNLSVPIFMYLMAIFFLREPIIKKALLGCITGLAGGIMIIGLPAIGPQAIEIGDVLLFISALIFALAIIHAKYIYKWLKPTEVVTYRFLIAGIAIMAFVFAQQGFMVLEGITPAGWSALIYSITISGAFALPLFYWALKKLPAEDVAPIIYADPLTGAIGSAILLGEEIAPVAYIGVGFIAIGLLISHPHQHHLFHRMHIRNHHWLLDFRRWLQGRGAKLFHRQ